MSIMMKVPIITIDGPGGAGKGTIGRLLAQRLGFHFLDSGALYRLVALKAGRLHIDLQDDRRLVQIALGLDVSFSQDLTTHQALAFLEGQEVSECLREELIGNEASRVAAIPAVREALLARQRAFATSPGLVADGRDMGTVIFPEAEVKLFLTASAVERAARRYGELRERGLNVTLATLLLEIEERDHRDQTRPIAPLKPAPDGVIIDTTGKNILEVLEEVLACVVRKIGAVGDTRLQ